MYVKSWYGLNISVRGFHNESSVVKLGLRL
jgi:hypothetical protein